MIFCDQTNQYADLILVQKNTTIRYSAVSYSQKYTTITLYMTCNLILGCLYRKFLEVYISNHNVLIVPYFKLIFNIINSYHPIIFKFYLKIFIHFHHWIVKITKLGNTSKYNLSWKFSSTWSCKKCVDISWLVKRWLLFVSQVVTIKLFYGIFCEALKVYKDEFISLNVNVYYLLSRSYYKDATAFFISGFTVATYTT